MGVLTDLFQATDGELAETFRGWKLPLPLRGVAVKKEGRNPFTGKMMTFTTRERDGLQPVADPDAVEDGDFRKLPWIDMKGLDPTMLESLGAALLGWTEERASGEVTSRMLIGPKGGEVCVFVVPRDLVDAMARVASAAPAERAAAIERWTEADTRIDAKTAARLLETLGAFASSAIESGRSIYMWMCP
jgi:hypothetical protein